MSKTQEREIRRFIHLIVGKHLDQFVSSVFSPHTVPPMQEFERTSFWVQFADSPCVLSYLEAHFKGADALQHALLEEADDSAFSLHQWVEALIVLSQWLEVHGFHLSIEDHIGYVSCATVAAGSAVNLTHLPGLVEDFLEQHGCERAVKK